MSNLYAYIHNMLTKQIEISMDRISVVNILMSFILWHLNWLKSVELLLSPV